MDGLIKTIEKKEVEEEFSFKEYFVPLTTAKAITWILIIGLIVYFNMLFNGFVWDDEAQITANYFVQSLTHIPQFFIGGTYASIEGTLTGSYYRPLMLTVFSIFYSIFGMNAFPYHLLQLIFHIINAILVFILLRYFIKPSFAFSMSLIFLVHPMNQESVGFISHIQDTMFFLFGVLALFFSKGDLSNKKKILFVNLFLLLSFLSKETGLIFVPLIFFYLLLIAKKKKLNLYFLLSLIFTTLFYLILRFLIVHIPIKESGLLVPIASESLIQRLVSIPAIFFYYIKTFFVPVKLSIDQLWIVKSIDVNNFYIPLFLDLFILLFLVAFGFYIYRYHKKDFRIFLFFTGWFMLGILVLLQIVPLDETVADHWFYFPMIGLLGLIGLTLGYINFNKNIIKSTYIFLSFLIICTLGIRTVVRNTNWVNNITLYTHDVQVSPDSFRLESNLGVELIRDKQYEVAKKHLEHVVRLEPMWSDNWVDLGLSYEYTGELVKAREYYQKSIQMDQSQKGYENLGGSYVFYDKDYKKASEILEAGIKKYPKNQRFWILLAVAQYNLNNNNEALNDATKAYEIIPSSEANYLLNQISNNLPITVH